MRADLELLGWAYLSFANYLETGDPLMSVVDLQERRKAAPYVPLETQREVFRLREMGNEYLRQHNTL